MQDLTAAEESINVVDEDVGAHISAMEHKRTHRESLLKVTFIPGLPVLVEAATNDRKNLGNIDQEDEEGSSRDSWRNFKVFIESERHSNLFLVPLASTHVCRKEADGGDDDRGVIGAREHRQVQHANVILFQRQVEEGNCADLDSENGGQTTSNLKNTGQHYVKDDGGRSVESVIKEHTHDRSCAISPRLLPIAVVCCSINEEGYATVDSKPRCKIALCAIAIEENSHKQAAKIPAEAPDSDSVGSEPRWKLRDNPIAQWTLHVFVVEAITRAFRPMVHDLLIVLFLDVRAV